MDGRIVEALAVLTTAIEAAPDVDAQIDLLNFIRGQLHAVSPLRHHPVDLVVWERAANLEANDYNPNHVDRRNMELLRHSIREDGYTMPIVTSEEQIPAEAGGAPRTAIKIVDGYHRRKAERSDNLISRSTYGRIPRTQIRNEKRDLKSRMASTVRHNRARGVHGVEPMSYLVVELVQLGWSDAQIALHLGMEADEVLRLKQVSGIAEIFQHLEYTASWTFQELDASG
jgi:ParB-like chromosome segregation protein Spo0J